MMQVHLVYWSNVAYGLLNKIVDHDMLLVWFHMIYFRVETPMRAIQYTVENRPDKVKK